MYAVVMEHCGQYTILGNIGEGAHGIVFKAKHIEVSIPFILRVMKICLAYNVTRTEK